MPHVTARDGVRLHYTLHDYADPWKKPRLLFLHHGYGRDGRFWYPLVPYLARFYRVVCNDIRGMGQSTGDIDYERAFTLDNVLDDVLRIVDDVGADDFHYAGDSTGGLFGMFLAAREPQRIRTLCTMSSPYRIEPRAGDTLFSFGHGSRAEAEKALGRQGMSDAAGSAIRFPPGTDPGLMKWYADEIAAGNPQALPGLLTMSRALDAEPCLPRIRAPMLGIYPTNAKLVPQAQQDTMRRLVPDLRLVNLPNEFHYIWATAPATCAMHLLHFIAAHDGIPCRDA